MKQYVEILSDALGFEWDSNVLHVHHINHDHQDNRVNNLLLLPKKLHGRYHMLYNMASSHDNILSKGLDQYLPQYGDCIKKLIDVKIDMCALENAQSELMFARTYLKEIIPSVYYWERVCRIYQKYM